MFDFQCHDFCAGKSTITAGINPIESVINSNNNNTKSTWELHLVFIGIRQRDS